MTDNIQDEIETQSVHLFEKMKLPKRVRLGLVAYDDFNKSFVCKDIVTNKIIKNDRVIREYHTSVGILEVVKDENLPPNSVVVED